MHKRYLFLAIAAAVVGVAGSIGFAWLSGDSGAAAQVEVRSEGTAVATQDPGTALGDASAKVGFKVLPITELPAPEMRLWYVDTHLGPPDTLSPLKFAVVGYSAGGQAVDAATPTLTVFQFNGKMESPAVRPSTEGQPRAVDLGLPGVELWKHGTDLYTLIVGDRTFDIETAGLTDLPNDYFIRLAKSLK